MLPAIFLTPDCTSFPGSGRESCNAGDSPKRITVANAKPMLKKRTGRLILTEDSEANMLYWGRRTLMAATAP